MSTYQYNAQSVLKKKIHSLLKVSHEFMRKVSLLYFITELVKDFMEMLVGLAVPMKHQGLQAGESFIYSYSLSINYSVLWW